MRTVPSATALPRTGYTTRTDRPLLGPLAHRVLVSRLLPVRVTVRREMVPVRLVRLMLARARVSRCIPLPVTLRTT
jgi:hypothetical protein